MFRRATHRRWCALLGVGLLACVAGPASAFDDPEADDDALRGYLSANGLLNRGLHALAEKEYREFLREYESHPKTPIARYGLAVCLYRTEQHAAAAKELALLSDDDDFAFAAEARAILGQCRLALKEYAAAAKAFEELLREHKSHALADDAAALLIEAYYLDGKHKAAARQSAKFESRWPKSNLRERTLFFWGLSDMALGDHKAAAERFSQLLKTFPQSNFSEQTAFLLAQCHHREGALDQAMRWYRRVLKNAEGEHTPDALFGLATLLHKRGDPKGAGELLDKLLQQHADSPLVTQASLLRGRTWFEQSEYARAAEMFGHVERADGELAAQAAYWLAKCRLREGAFAQAARRLKKALERHPKSELRPEMRYDLGVSLARAGEEKAAIGALETFLSEHPQHAMAADALSLLATLEHRQSNYERSRTLCRRFLDEYDDHGAAGGMRFLSAENDFLMERYEDALRGYRRFLSKHGRDPQAAKAGYRLGMTLFRLERFDEALPPLHEAAELARSDDSFRACELMLGEIFFQRGEWKPAEEHLRAYVAFGLDKPSADDALLKLGLALQRQDKHGEARRAFERLLAEFEDSPHRLHAIFERGQTLVALNETDEAIGAFTQTVKEGPKSRFAPFALNHLGAIAARRDQRQQAAEYFSRVLDARPDQELEAEVLFQLGETLLASSRFEAALGSFKRFLEKHARHKLAPRAQARLAVALARLDRPKDALKAIQRVESKHAKQLDDATRTSLRYEKAWCLRELGRGDEAAAEYRGLLKTGTDPALTAHALLELAEIEAGGKQYKEAVTLLERFRIATETSDVEISADARAQALYRLGVCRFELGNSKEAGDTLEEFLSSFPDHKLAASASFFCGEALLKIRRNERAAKHFARVVEDFKDDATYGPALLRLGECLSALQRWARSEEVFNEYLRTGADNQHWYQARFGVGWARENQQRYGEAIDAYREVAKRHKGVTAARAQFQIGECLFAQEQLEEAVRELLKVDILYAYPEWSAAALYEAGRCFEQLGRAVEARAQYKTVREKHPKSRWAQLAAQRLAAVSDGALPGGRNRDQ